MNLADTIIEYAPIAEPGDRASRRQAERDAVMQLLRKRFGAEVSLVHDADGAPSVEGFHGHISISHCAGIAALAVNDTRRIGIDVERLRSQLHRIKSKYLTAREIPEYTTTRQLLQIWTAKEAVYKAAGIPGLPLAAIEVLPPADWAIVTTAEGGVRRFKIYSSFTDEVMTTVAIPE